MPTPNRAVVELDDIKLEIWLEYVDADSAQHYLTFRGRQRRLQSSLVSKVLNSMRRDEWCVNGETVVFDSGGCLVDGQHRLEAIVRYGKPIMLLMVQGVEPIRAQDTTGGGRPRTLGTQLEMRGEASTTALAAAIGVVHRLTTTGDLICPLTSITQGLGILERCPDIRESLKVGRRAISPPLRYPQGLAGALHYLFVQVDQDDADAFWARLCDGTDLSEDDPIMVLRNRMVIDASRAGGKSAMKPRYRAAITIKAWNLWRDGETCRQLKWRPGGSTNEPFPRWDESVNS